MTDDRTVVLAVAPPGSADVLDAPTFLGRMPNIGILYLASMLEREGHTAYALDRHYDAITPFQLAAEILSLCPRLVGFTLFDLTMEFTEATIRILRNLYDGPIVVGGYTATFHAEDILREWPDIDYVVANEGEEAIVQLVRHLDGSASIDDVPHLYYRGSDGICYTHPTTLVDVDVIPWPQRKWREQEDVTPLITRRGCTSRCSFCSMVPFYDRKMGSVVRYRNPTDVVDEIEHCMAHGRREFMFYDDDFGLATRADQEWTERFITAVQRRRLDFHFGVELRVLDVNRGTDLLPGLCDIGMTHMALGMESLLPRQLTLYNKGYQQDDVLRCVETCDALPVDYQTNVIFWDPWTTMDEAAEHLELLDAIQIQNQLSSANYPFYAGTLTARKGTALHDQLTGEGLLRRSRLFYRHEYDFQNQLTANFHKKTLFNFLQRTRGAIRRPPTLWMLVPRLDRGGFQRLGDELRAAGRALARTEFEYFQRLVGLTRELGTMVDTSKELMALQEEMDTRLANCAAAFPPVPHDVITSLDASFSTFETVGSG